MGLGLRRGNSHARIGSNTRSPVSSRTHQNSSLQPPEDMSLVRGRASRSLANLVLVGSGTRLLIPARDLGVAVIGGSTRILPCWVRLVWGKRLTPTRETFAPTTAFSMGLAPRVWRSGDVD